MGEAGEAGLKDGGAQEKGGPRPESFDGLSSQLFGDDLRKGEILEGCGTFQERARVRHTLTGKATDREVPSKATIMVMTASVRNTRYMRGDGFHKKLGTAPGTPAGSE